MEALVKTKGQILILNRIRFPLIESPLGQEALVFVQGFQLGLAGV